MPTSRSQSEDEGLPVSLSPLEREEPSSEAVAEELRGLRQALANHRDEVALWKVRAEVAEAALAKWETRQNRSLWRILTALDQLRLRVAPPGTRREAGTRIGASVVAHGFRRRRRPKSAAPQSVDSSRQKAILFVTDEDGPHRRYRCDHLSEQLRFLGTSSDVVYTSHVDLVRAVDRYESFILHRVRWSDDIAMFIDRARAARKSVFFGADDLIFEPALHRYYAFLDNSAEQVRASWIKRLLRYRKTLESCDGAILLEHARKHTGLVEVVYNGVSEEMLRLADEARGGAPASAENQVTVAYLSGTNTHERDFMQAADAVLLALETFPQMQFLAVGEIDLDPRFERFSTQVRKVPLQPWRALPALLARVDVNLAPVESDNPFTECKSCVKYLEASLLAVPTVASPRPDFVRVIKSGWNGFLAEGPTEWHDALRVLIESRELRREIGRRAEDDVRRNHTTKASADRVGQALAALASA